MTRLSLRLTGRGHLVLEPAADAGPVEERAAARLVEAFGRGTGFGLLQLGGGEAGQGLPPEFLWWRDFAARYVAGLCLGVQGEAETATLPGVPPPGEAELATLVLTAPMMTGAESLCPGLLRTLWAELAGAAAVAFAETETTLEEFLKRLNPAWNVVGRVHFNLAENRRDPEQPFAFLATYTSRLSARATAQHVPLGQALQEYAGTANRERLLSLLVPVQRAAERCRWLKAMVDGGEIFHPIRWSPAEAARFLKSAAELEAAGVIVRMPASWRVGRPPRPQVRATVGSKLPSALGLDGLLDFRMDLTLGDEPLDDEEIAALLAGTETLVLLRGQWVEVDRERLRREIDRFEQARKLAAREGLSFAEAMRLLAGAAVAGDDNAEADPVWSSVVAGPWLAETLKALRNPDGAGADPGPALNGTLRPYQRTGVEWLRLLSGLGLGACLADDMGLGKTIQVLALLLVQRAEAAEAAHKPCLLVAPASLLANWAAEIDRFAPDLTAGVVHPSAMPADALKRLEPGDLQTYDLVITSYGTLLRLPALSSLCWRMVIIDEAQAIKNPGAKQTRAVKALKAGSRIALTGTPVENHLGDLWSIFDFINPGLLGSAKQFSRYTGKLAKREHNPYGPLRELVRPYILRRMKTDKSVIADLPEKTEVTAWCPLSRKQAALYAKAVADLTEALQEADGIQRKGIVLSTLMRLKQICNHPSQWLNDGGWSEADSGKFERLREIAEVVASRQDKMLVFTQFREATDPLAAFLTGVFGRPGLVLHGETAVRKRKELVARFQDDDDTPFFVLSLKAGGAGLNLTAASHVVHFDRWWNPAVENQATDRAFRIGQKRNVLVHKFVCRGTVEEKIDGLIASKKAVSDELLAGSGEINLTEMTDDALLKLVAFDLSAALED